MIESKNNTIGKANMKIPTCEIVIGDCIESMRRMADGAVNCCVTSPPYFGLRDYGHNGQIGLEDTPEAYVQKMVEVFREVRRVLRDDGTLWLNLGDSYASGGMSNPSGKSTLNGGKDRGAANYSIVRRIPDNCKQKDLLGIPWRVAFALQADGWYLRQDIIWHKPNPMPESVRDRCTKAHEYLFLLSKSARYYYDHDVIREPVKPTSGKNMRAPKCGNDRPSGTSNQTQKTYSEIKGANRRSVWTVSTKPYSGAHFAVYPPELIQPCIRAGCPVGGTVMDPFGGSGTTGMVALEEGRNAILCELNPEYVEIARNRTNVSPGLGI